MKILYIGDIVARIGRRAVQQVLPKLRDEKQIDFVIAQSENMSTGNGLTINAVNEMREAGVDFFTGGNHSFKKSEFYSYFDDPSVPVIRPANYPSPSTGSGFPTPKTPGRGWAVAETPYGNILVINVMGKTYNGAEYDHPLKTIDAILEANKHEKLAASFIDFHGDLTSEKMAAGFYYDGRVSAVVGSHTHVSTADPKILAGGTAHITDVGMTGPVDSVLGVKKEIIIQQWLTQMPVRHDWPRTGAVQFSSVLIDVDASGKAKSIEQILRNAEVN